MIQQPTEVNRGYTHAKYMQMTMVNNLKQQTPSGNKFNISETRRFRAITHDETNMDALVKQPQAIHYDGDMHQPVTH